MKNALTVTSIFYIQKNINVRRNKMKKPQLGDIIIFKNSTIGRIVDETHGMTSGFNK